VFKIKIKCVQTREKHFCSTKKEVYLTFFTPKKDYAHLGQQRLTQINDNFRPFG
jgi:hypothetical protein